MYMEGMTDAEVADYFQIDTATLGRWAIAHPEFRAAIKMSKEVADDRVERSLFQRACGYRYRAQKAMIVDKAVEIVEYNEHVLPETVACIFWLKNRRPELWRDVHKMEHGQPGEFSKLTDNDLARALLEEVEQLSIRRETKTNGSGDAVRVPTQKSNGTIN